MSFRRLQGVRIYSFVRTGEEPSFHTVTNISPFVVSRSSIHMVCDKLSERLCHLRKRLCQTSEMVVQSAWHSCATAMAQSCQGRGTSMPKGWHEQSIPSTPRPLYFPCPSDRTIVKDKDRAKFLNNKSANACFTGILSVPSMPGTNKIKSRKIKIEKWRLHKSGRAEKTEIRKR